MDACRTSPRSIPVEAIRHDMTVSLRSASDRTGKKIIAKIKEFCGKVLFNSLCFVLAGVTSSCRRQAPSMSRRTRKSRLLTPPHCSTFMDTIRSDFPSVIRDRVNDRNRE